MFDFHRLRYALPPRTPLDALDTPENVVLAFGIHPLTAMWWIRLKRTWQAGFFHADDCGPDGSEVYS